MDTDQRDVNEDIIPLGTVGEVSDVLDTLGGDQGSVLHRGAANWQHSRPVLPKGAPDRHV